MPGLSKRARPASLKLRRAKGAGTPADAANMLKTADAVDDLLAALDRAAEAFHTDPGTLTELMFAQAGFWKEADQIRSTIAALPAFRDALRASAARIIAGKDGGKIEGPPK